MSEELPPGWAWAALGATADTQLGKMLSAKSRRGIKPRPYLRNQNVQWHRFDLSDVARMDFSDVEAQKYQLRPGDLLVCEGGEVGRCARWLRPAGEMYFQKALHRIRPYGGVETRWLEFFLHWSAETGRFEAHTSGSTIAHLPQRDLRQLVLPLAPVAESKRIVDALEEHFSRLDAAEATLSATSRKLDAWLTSFLTDACRGPWPKAQLSDIIKSLNNGVFVSRPSAQPPGSPIYRISAVRPLVLRTDDIRYADPAPKMADAYKVESGDILLTRYSGNPRFVGAAAVVPPGGAGILHPDKLIRVVADRSKALPGWIAAYLTVGEGRRGIEQRLKTTAGQVGISGSQLRTVQIAVPPLSHQQKMITKLGVLREAQERMQQQLDGVATQTQALRRSIIAAGFAGRLVPQDPEDEPASVLLERIAASRPTMPARQRRTA